MKELVLKAIFSILMLFKGSIAKAEAKSQSLLKAITWIKELDADAQAFSQGKELPPIDTGSTVLNWIEGSLLEYLQTEEAKAPENFKAVLNEVSTNLLALLSETDPEAYKQLVTPAADPKASAVEQINSHIVKMETAVSGLNRASGDIGKPEVATTVTYHTNIFIEALTAIKALLQKI